MLVGVVSSLDESHKGAVTEVRLDKFDSINFDAIKHFIHTKTKPVIFTHRGENSIEVLKMVAQFKPEYIDLDISVSLEQAWAIKQISPKTKLIRSFHNFDGTPSNLDKIFQSMRNDVFSVYKIVTQANSSIDTLRMLQFVRNSKQPIVRHCMGELGTFGRVLGAPSNYFTYANADENDYAPGMLSVDTMLNVYHADKINPDTRFFALIGNPVEQSLGHIVYNEAFRERNQNAVYVKINLEKDELADFFTHIKALPFDGLSVTMPYKFDVISLLDEIDETASAIQAVNTIYQKDNHWLGTNTDAPGGLDAIEAFQSVSGKHVAILGAGGAAQAIAFEAKKRGATVAMFNRTMDRPGVTHSLSQLTEPFESGIILINTLPLHAFDESLLGALKKVLNKDMLVMDLVYNPQHTPLLNLAKSSGCFPVYGQSMYVNQARRQWEIWNA